MYRIILADPPWKYNERKNPKAKFGQGVGCYSAGVMSVDDLCSLGDAVKAVSALDAYLFQWICLPDTGKKTGNGMANGLKVMEAWGFRYVSPAFVWVKTNADGSFRKGVGNYVPSNTEMVLLGVRGRPWHSKKGWKPNQIISSPLVRGVDGKIIHSRKPVQLYENIEQWLTPQIGNGKMLELFATEKREGWTSLGHEISGKDIREELKELL